MKPNSLRWSSPPMAGGLSAFAERLGVKVDDINKAPDTRRDRSEPLRCCKYIHIWAAHLSNHDAWSLFHLDDYVVSHATANGYYLTPRGWNND